MTFLAALNFIHFRLADLIDIFIVAFLIYELYSLLKGTTALKIFWGIALVFIFYQLASLFHLGLLTEIMGQVISVGVIALIVVFQPEIRSFLLYLGNRRFIKILNGKLIRRDNPQKFVDDIDAIVSACNRMARTRTGALIVMAKEAPLDDFINTGEKIDSRVSRELIENIFYKNSPLHDGAIIIKNHRIDAARCILPVSRTEGLPTDLGLRHRSAIGATTLTDAIAIVVSEQTGSISLCKGGVLLRDISSIVLQQMLTDEFITSTNQKEEEEEKTPPVTEGVQ